MSESDREVMFNPRLDSTRLNVSGANDSTVVDEGIRTPGSLQMVDRPHSAGIQCVESSSENNMQSLLKRIEFLEGRSLPQNNYDMVDHGVQGNNDDYFQNRNHNGNSPVRGSRYANDNYDCDQYRGNGDERDFGAQNRERGNNSSRSRVSVKPQKYDGSDDFDEYFTQFEIIAELNNWSYQDKSLYLGSSLAGDARGILSELNRREKRDYKSLVSALDVRFGAVEKSELFRARLQARVQSKGESYPELAHSVRKTTRKAYPGADSNTVDLLALENFIEAVSDSDLRLRLRDARPRDITEAELIAVRFQTHRDADRQRFRPQRQINSTYARSSSPEVPKESEFSSAMKMIANEMKQNNQNNQKIANEMTQNNQMMKQVLMNSQGQGQIGNGGMNGNNGMNRPQWNDNRMDRPQWSRDGNGGYNRRNNYTDSRNRNWRDNSGNIENRQQPAVNGAANRNSGNERPSGWRTTPRQ